MSARFLGAMLVLSTAWYAWPWRSPGLSVLAICVHVLVASFAAAIAGKIIGIGLYRRGKRRGPAAGRGQGPGGSGLDG